MGTLFNQSPRNYDRCESSKKIVSEIEMIQNISSKTGLTVDQVINTCTMLEMRRKNNLYVMNGDAFDEQISGIGKLMEDFIQAFKAAFVVTDLNDRPTALEAIAMTLGYDNPCPIADSIDCVANQLESIRDAINER